MSDKVILGDAVWSRRGFGFIVNRIRIEGNRPVYYGIICGEEIYCTSETCHKVDISPIDFARQEKSES